MIEEITLIMILFAIGAMVFVLGVEIWIRFTRAIVARWVAFGEDLEEAGRKE